MLMPSPVFASVLIEVTTDMLAPISDTIVANINTILPWGIGIFGLLLAIRLVPAILSHLLRVG